MSTRYNSRSSAVKRILQELKELGSDDNPDILAEALEDNIFEWHFVIRGAWDTEFEGGIYHGRILMPAEYPFKPPAFVMLTPSGRFETGTKICLSISSHHPESWQPSWSVRSALVALVAFMQTPGSGALGSLDHPAEVRRQMALESRTQVPVHGGEERQALINRLHAEMLEQETISRQRYKQDVQRSDSTPLAVRPDVAEQDDAGVADSPALAAAGNVASSNPDLLEASIMHAPAPTTTAAVEEQPPGEDENEAAAASGVEQQQLQQHESMVPAGMIAQQHVQQHSWEDRGLTYLAVLLGVLILALLIRKVLVASGSPYKSGEEVFGLNHVGTAPDMEL